MQDNFRDDYGDDDDDDDDNDDDDDDYDDDDDLNFKVSLAFPKWQIKSI